MYRCYMGIITVGNDRKIPEIIRNCPKPEDCQAAVIEQGALTEPVEAIDSIVIFDTLSDFRESRDYIGEGVFTVVIVTPEEAVNAPEDAGDIWVIPAENSESLIAFYAKKLIADRMNAFDYRLQTICMNTAFDSIPDLVWFKDIRGAHLSVNNAFCDAVGKTKEQIYKQGHYYIWDIPKEDYDKGDFVCLESEETVINAGRTCAFDENVQTKSGMHRFFTYKSPLTDVDGRTFGTCGIASDVTSQHNINSELEVILDSMPFAIFIESCAGTVLAANSLFGSIFPEYRDITDKSSREWRQTYLKNADSSKEINVKVNGEEYILVCTERPIFSIFHENIGTLVILMDVTRQSKSTKKNTLMANTDFLTGLYNRRMLFSHLGLHRCDEHMAMITVDLDNFKDVNDTYGHHAGDRALVDTSRLLKDCFRQDFAARLGGDEFLIVSTRGCTREELAAETEKFLTVLKNHYSGTKEFSELTASAGIALSTLEGDKKEHDVELLLRQSDSALYKAKFSGKNMCMIYKPE